MNKPNKIAIRGDFFCICEKKVVPLPANMRFYEKKSIHTAILITIVVVGLPSACCA
jgi:hypothetical protein